VTVVWTHHARSALVKRGLDESEIVRILGSPTWIVPDHSDASLKRAFGKHIGIDQWIRVVFRNLAKDDILVVTVHPDRDALPPTLEND
jgi:hypothetical protein